MQATSTSDVSHHHCLWQGCGKHFKNSVGLSSHIICHLNEKDLVEGKFVCLWEGCNQHLEWIRKNCLVHLQTHAKLKTKRMAKAARVQTSNFIRLTTSKAGPEKITSQNGDLPEFTYLEGQSSSSKHSVSVEDELEEDVGDDSQDDQPLMLRLAITRAHAAQGQPSSPPNNLSAPLPLVPRLVGLSDVHQDTDSHLREVSRTLKSMVSDNGEGGVASQPPVPRINDAEKLSFDQKALKRQNIHEITTGYLADIDRLLATTQLPGVSGHQP